MKTPDIFSYDHLKSHVLSLMPPHPVTYMVTQKQQHTEIEALKANIGSRRFFFVNNLERFEVEHVYGVRQWLGYPEQDFTLKWYLDHVVHPGKRGSIILVARQLYDTLCIGKFQLSFMVQRYNSLIALKHYNGHYLLVNKISSVFQYDKSNKLTAYLNEFTIIGEYDGQAMAPDFFNNDGKEEPRGKEILEKTMQQFLQLGLIAESEWIIARKFAYEPGITKARIAESMGLKENTVKEYGERLKIKVEKLFQRKFSSVAEIGKFLKEEGLL